MRPSRVTTLRKRRPIWSRWRCTLRRSQMRVWNHAPRDGGIQTSRMVRAVDSPRPASRKNILQPFRSPRSAQTNAAGRAKSTTSNSVTRSPNRTLNRIPCLSGPSLWTSVHAGSQSGMRPGSVSSAKTCSIGAGTEWLNVCVTGRIRSRCSESRPYRSKTRRPEGGVRRSARARRWRLERRSTPLRRSTWPSFTCRRRSRTRRRPRSRRLSQPRRRGCSGCVVPWGIYRPGRANSASPPLHTRGHSTEAPAERRNYRLLRRVQPVVRRCHTRAPITCEPRQSPAPLSISTLQARRGWGLTRS
jgi:hypothetical protein